MRTLTCDMEKGCTGEVTHLDVKGWFYCAKHGPERRESGIRCRRLRKWELDEARQGKPIPSYTPGPKPKEAAAS